MTVRLENIVVVNAHDHDDDDDDVQYWTSTPASTRQGVDWGLGVGHRRSTLQAVVRPLPAEAAPTSEPSLIGGVRTQAPPYRLQTTTAWRRPMTTYVRTTIDISHDNVRTTTEWKRCIRTLP